MLTFKKKKPMKMTRFWSTIKSDYNRLVSRITTFDVDSYIKNIISIMFCNTVYPHVRNLLAGTHRW